MTKEARWILFCAFIIGLKITFLPMRTAASNSLLSLNKIIENRHQKLRQHMKAPENADFTISTTLGEKRWLNPATRKLHQKFNLAHLFTPSGLHFSSLMFVIGFFVKRRVLKIFIFLSPLLFNSFYSCKRVGLLFGVREVMPKISLYALFLLVMALDLLFGTFKENPMSFLYSFTFLGIFITQGHSSRLQLFLNILSANLILSFVTNSPITPWGIFWGLILTPIFSLAFPLLFVCVAAPILSFPTEFLINSWFKILSLIPAPEFYFTASLPLITAFFFLRKLPKIAIIFLLFIHSEGLFNEKKTKSYGSERPLPLHVVSKQVRIKSGYRSDSKLWRIRCYSKMQGSEWRVRCSDLPAKQLVRK